MFLKIQECFWVLFHAGHYHLAHLPIVEMGLFINMERIPIAFGISPGNSNEQNTMIPLEKKLTEKFDMSRFVVCTDAGLSSAGNRYYNNYDKGDGCRFFITTQSVKN